MQEIKPVEMEEAIRSLHKVQVELWNLGTALTRSEANPTFYENRIVPLAEHARRLSTYVRSIKISYFSQQEEMKKLYHTLEHGIYILMKYEDEYKLFFRSYSNLGLFLRDMSNWLKDLKTYLESNDIDRIEHTLVAMDTRLFEFVKDMDNPK